MGIPPLKSSPDTIRFQFFLLSTARDVADLLAVEYKVLVYHLHKTPLSRRYITFSLKKKSGGVRQICAPGTALKILQAKLNYVLQQIYSPKPYIYGFVPDGGIVRNAEVHSRKRFVLNIDLLDFFPSIHFGRVRGMFTARPYNCKPTVATVLAQICCLPKEYPAGPPYAQLPQGSPTSPIISNMICAKLDSQLRRLAQKYKCSYTRYADDLTFSTNLNRFPESLARFVTDGTGVTSVVIGSELEETISSNKFQINRSKIRLQRSAERQTVTGLTTNESPNITRKYSRQIRAMLHSWKTYGYEKAEKEFHDKYWIAASNRNPSKSPPRFRDVVKGKVEFLGMVRGKTDLLYIHYLKKLRDLAPEMVAGKLLDLMDAVWVLESESPYAQGTAFMLKGYGLVTCNHVLRPETCAFRADKPDRKYSIEVIRKDRDLDLAILKIECAEIPFLEPEDGDLPRPDEWTILAGFPNYSPHTTGVVRRGRVTGYYRSFEVNRMLIETPIVYGNSGGPVLNQKKKVVGIAAKGASTLAEAHKIEKFEVIPISALRTLLASPS